MSQEGPTLTEPERNRLYEVLTRFRNHVYDSSCYYTNSTLRECADHFPTSKREMLELDPSERKFNRYGRTILKFVELFMSNSSDEANREPFAAELLGELSDSGGPGTDPFTKPLENAVLQRIEDVVEICLDMQTLEQEVMQVITIGGRSKMLNRHLVSLGTVNGTMSHPRDVFRYAIKDNATHIVVAHNHPYGDPTPSEEDIALTNQLIQAGSMLEIPLMDHVIIGKGCFFSFRETGTCTF